MADRVVGLSAFGNILGALYHRQKTGEGQRLDIPMFETMTQFVLGDHMGGRSFEPPLGQPGYARLLAESRRPFRTSDGQIGRASCRERVCQSVEISVVAVSLQKTKKT